MILVWLLTLTCDSRLLLNTDNLNDHFESLEEPLSGPQLLTIAKQLVFRWASTHAYDIAMFSNTYWEGPKGPDVFSDSSDSDSDVPLVQRRFAQRSVDTGSTCERAGLCSAAASGFRGDHCLANSIIRMRDSLWHFEFNWAVADGDIGRVMQVMSVSLVLLLPVVFL
jgi:hypothetical protein